MNVIKFLKKIMYGIMLVIFVPSIFLFMLVIKIFLVIPETIAEFLEVLEKAFEKGKEGKKNDRSK